MRLFPDEPGLIWKAQLGLLRDSMRRIWLVLFPTAVLAVPALLLMPHLDALYGNAPFAEGQPIVVTAQMKDWFDLGTKDTPLLKVPEGFALETPAVRSVAGGQVSWRLRAVKPSSGLVHIEADGEPVMKTISADPASWYLSKRRAGSVLGFVENSTEPPMFHNAIAWVEVAYPTAEVAWMGIKLHWLTWFIIVMTGVWIVAARWMRLSF
jgi:hypothetical protein